MVGLVARLGRWYENFMCDGPPGHRPDMHYYGRPIYFYPRLSQRERERMRRRPRVISAGCPRPAAEDTL